MELGEKGGGLWGETELSPQGREAGWELVLLLVQRPLRSPLRGRP